MSHRTKSYNLVDLPHPHQTFWPTYIHALPKARRHLSPPVKLRSEQRPFYNTFTAYGPGWVEVNEVRHTTSIIVMPEGDILPWQVQRFAELDATSFLPILPLAPEIVIFGSGDKLRFAPAQVLRDFASKRIGIETMDLFAACRTYNILMTEGRKVAAALLIEMPGQVS
jgi:uncharacterized protein